MPCPPAAGVPPRVAPSHRRARVPVASFAAGVPFWDAGGPACARLGLDTDYRALHAGVLIATFRYAARALRPFADERRVVAGDENWRGQLTEQVCQTTEMPRNESDVVVCAIFDSIVRPLRSGDKVEIRGFGSFHTRQRRARIGRNPKTGARFEVPPKNISFFKPSKELRELVSRI